ncbi:MAG: hypothetical protein ACREJ9_06330 [Candidatus Rokuibacteriota bacterium]
MSVAEVRRLEMGSNGENVRSERGLRPRDRFRGLGEVSEGAGETPFDV